MNLRQEADKLADSMVETVAKAGYLPQNRTYTELEIKEFTDTLVEEIEAALTRAYQQGRKEAEERDEWLWCATIISTLGMSNIQKVVDRFFLLRDSFEGKTAEDMRASTINRKIEATND